MVPVSLSAFKVNLKEFLAKKQMVSIPSDYLECGHLPQTILRNLKKKGLLKIYNVDEKWAKKYGEFVNCLFCLTDCEFQGLLLAKHLGKSICTDCPVIENYCREFGIRIFNIASMA